MDIDAIPERHKKTAYEMIRAIYKFIPHYNKIKGTYLGIQFVLNTMGICSAIDELWTPKTDIHNFERNAPYISEDEINASRRFISEIKKASIENYFLTSRFDLKIYDLTGITFEEFNGMADTIIDVVLAIRPVTRCLRMLYYTLLINTDIHFNHLFEFERIEPEIKTYNYIWKLTGESWTYKTVYDKILGQIENIFLPYNAVGAIYYNNKNNTLKNTYSILNGLENDFRVSGWNTFRFKLYIREKNDVINLKEEEYVLKIGTDINIETVKNGINLVFSGPAKTLLNGFFSVVDFETMDIFVASTVSVVLGKKYKFQDPAVEIKWNI